MTASELRDLLIGQIVRTHGGSRARWRRAVSEVRVYPRETHAHCNWEVRAGGTAGEIAAIERAADQLRPGHPFVDAG